MMTALATVTEVVRQSGRYQVTLSCEQQTSCSSCSSQKSCGTGVVSKAMGNKTLHWQLDTGEPVQVGQVVEIGFPESSLIKSAMAVYLFPLFGLIFGALLGHFVLAPVLSAGEGAIILTSLGVAALGVGIAKRVSRPLEDASRRQVTLIRVLGTAIR